VVPLAGCGDAILFDYRVKHRGLGNNSSEPRPVVYVTYAKKGFVDEANFSARRYAKLPPQAYEIDYYDDDDE
jgi:ectoine hydroxylase-related dioxygenase (phytanoyl-CoA dioxygenase family)